LTSYSLVLAAGKSPESRQTVLRCTGFYKKKYAGNKYKSSKFMKIYKFAKLDKMIPDVENIRGLNLAAVKRMIVQVSSLQW
jgi:hypothetical protein